jgi:hypothetical protein
VIAVVAGKSVVGDDLSRRGLLFSAGLITGEALMGILLAMPIALGAFWPGVNPDPFVLFDRPPYGGWPGLLIVTLVGAVLYRVATDARRSR